jgi:hypothetical protein
MIDARRAAEAMREAAENACAVIARNWRVSYANGGALGIASGNQSAGAKQCELAIRALPLPDATPQATGVREIAISVLSNCAMQYVDGNSQRSIDRAIDLAVPILTAARDAEIARLSAELEAALEALRYGEAWTEEYLQNCKDENILAEVERVEFGLAKIRAALAKFVATKGV